MPSNKQRREAAQRRLQRQLERRAELARKRRRNLLIGVTAAAVVLVVATVLLITGIGGDDADPAAAEPTPAPTAPATPGVVDGSDGTCDWTPADTTANPNLQADTGTPPVEVAPAGTTEVDITTNVGPIGLTLDNANAPCAVASMVYLAGQGYFDDTACHRETDSEGLAVLQCGDPSGTGAGGPAYEFPTQVTGDETYPRGTVAMANSGQGFDGSQFFLVHGDSQLPPSYTVLGTIDEAGLATLAAIAANGNDGSNGPGDGAPTQEVRIQSLTVAA
ncbi:peptidylprolyl isomerase [Geodermatophilus obscurus]|uniref:Peptidyl-prolyl cis-trans isomerase cyclophilin type n=1 Tax=Geodermatophilus obscurus (strain ATCC 25078 / DSM 43160 / JCM 3152 / CCUG 61914 / KCC A-0152 / KCTC 9177 / NBRC 13315 / NRRL B-3577 / G-20) TaxID=526225 RepID=D2S9H4_GEOOG|nr:peptidylprolyl isomerase [Geodermatophilus obscurus]ADB75774.1 peptidyl-prolyl cis-trans isomerase cyclophilin type [Geodermatophilus obscurus DSM 43160]